MLTHGDAIWQHNTRKEKPLKSCVKTWAVCDSAVYHARISLWHRTIRSVRKSPRDWSYIYLQFLPPLTRLHAKYLVAWCVSSNMHTGRFISLYSLFIQSSQEATLKYVDYFRLCFSCLACENLNMNTTRTQYRNKSNCDHTRESLSVPVYISRRDNFGKGRPLVINSNSKSYLLWQRHFKVCFLKVLKPYRWMAVMFLSFLSIWCSHQALCIG